MYIVSIGSTLYFDTLATLKRTVAYIPFFVIGQLAILSQTCRLLTRVKTDIDRLFISPVNNTIYILHWWIDLTKRFLTHYE